MAERSRFGSQGAVAAGTESKKKDRSVLEPVIRFERTFRELLSLSARPNEQAVFSFAAKSAQQQLSRWFTHVGQSAGDGDGTQPGRKRQTPQISLEWGLREFTRLRDRFLHRIARVKRRSRIQYRSNDCLSFPGTVRRNLRYGGTLLHLLYRAPLRRTPRILVLCDVSSSMLKHIVFTVSFSQILHHVIPQTKVFLCANGLEPMTLGRLDVSSFLAKANELLGESSQIGRGTNLGVSFDRLLQLMQDEGTQYTHLFIISDAETTEAPKAVEAIKRLRDSGLRILWLNPAPRRSWGENAFLSKARRYCSMRECCDFRQFVQWIRSGARIQ